MTKRKTEAKPISKKAQVQAMLAANPTSVAQIAEKLSISKQAAYSLIGDLKRGGVQVSGSIKDAAMHYSVAPVRKRAKAARTFGARVKERVTA